MVGALSTWLGAAFRGFPLSWMVAFAFAPLFGCGGDESSVVPFKQERTVSVAPAGSKPESGFALFEGEPLAEGTTQVAVEGATIVSPGGTLRALLPVDLDADGDRDAVVVREDAGSVTVAAVRRDGKGFTPLRDLAPVFAPAVGCITQSTAIRTLTPTLGVASATMQCGQGGGAGAGAQPAAGAESGPATVHWVFSLEAEPRLRERLATSPGSFLQVTLRSEDRDQDGHADLIAFVVVPSESEPTTIELVWLDRPGGLARDRAEPAETLQSLSDEARKKLDSDVVGALASAERALAVHGKLCSEATKPLLHVGQSVGVPCGTDGSRARSVTVASLIRQKKLIEAVDALGSTPFSDAAGRDLVAAAWKSAATSSLRSRPVAEHAVEGRWVRFGSLAFASDGALLLRGPAPRRVDPETLEVQPLDPVETAPAPVRDPSGKRAVFDVHRACRGYVAEVAPVEMLAAGLDFVDSREVLIEAVEPPQGTRCDPLPSSFFEDRGGWTVLGWSPQGLVASRGSSDRVVPVDGAAVIEVEPGGPLPLPIRGLHSTPDGSTRLYELPYGLLVVRLAASTEARFLRPTDWKGPADAVALSPDGRRVAVLRGGKVSLVDSYW